MTLCQTYGEKSRLRAVRWIALFFLVGCVFSVTARAEKVENLAPQGYVNDFAGVLDAASKQSLTALCQEVDTQAGAQIALVTIHTLEGDTAADFANRLFQKWGVGPKGKDRGVLVLLAVDDHKYYTEVGYGLEPILPDGKVGGFGRDMLPLLRMNNYAQALSQMASQIAGVIAQDRGVTLSQPVLSSPQQPRPGPEGGAPFGIPPQLFLPLIFFLFFGGWRLLAFVLAMMGFSRYRRGRGNGGWWMGPMGGMGGGSGGGSWGGGGFGGFGGGSSGGGGAGGGW